MGTRAAAPTELARRRAASRGGSLGSPRPGRAVHSVLPCRTGGGALFRSAVEGDTALHDGIRNKHRKVALLLLEHDPQLANCVNNARETPLFLAAEMGLAAAEKNILTAMRRPEAEIDPPSNVSASHGKAPLHVAAIESRFALSLSHTHTFIYRKNMMLKDISDKTAISALVHEELLHLYTKSFRHNRCVGVRIDLHYYLAFWQKCELNLCYLSHEAPLWANLVCIV